VKKIHNSRTTRALLNL